MHLARSPLYLSLIPGDDEVVGVAYMASLANAPNTSNIRWTIDCPTRVSSAKVAVAAGLLQMLV